MFLRRSMTYFWKSTRNYANQVHVTYGETKRIISHQEGGEVRELRHRFLQVFSDVLLDQVAPANVKLQRYDDRFADYVELSCDEKLENNAKIRAVVLKQEQDKQTTSPSAPESETNWKHCWPHWVIPWYTMYAACNAHHWVPIFPSVPIFVRPHIVKDNASYQLWNPVSKQKDSLLQRSANNVVSCDGSFSSGKSIVIKTKKDTRANDYMSLLFEDSGSNKQYFVTATSGLGGKIEAIHDPTGASYTDKSKFEPVYYYGYTMFKNEHYSEYLGCDNSGNTTLVTNTSLQYPNPQALFILRQV